jgi:hypothetical protein
VLLCCAVLCRAAACIHRAINTLCYAALRCAIPMLLCRALMLLRFLLCRWLDTEEDLQAAMSACPVSCIHWVDRADLPALEFTVRNKVRLVVLPSFLPCPAEVEGLSRSVPCWLYVSGPPADLLPRLSSISVHFVWFVWVCCRAVT